MLTAIHQTNKFNTFYFRFISFSCTQYFCLLCSPSPNIIAGTGKGQILSSCRLLRVPVIPHHHHIHSWYSWAGRFSAQFSQLTPLSRLPPAILPCGISCELSGMCPQRLMARVPSRTGILSSLAEAERREGLIWTLLERSITMVYNAWPHRYCSAASLWQFQLLVYSIVNLNRILHRDQYSIIVNSCCLLCVHCSRLSPNQTLSVEERIRNLLSNSGIFFKFIVLVTTVVKY